MFNHHMSVIEAWPTLKQAAKMLDVKPRQIRRHHDFYETNGQLLTPTEVICLNGIFMRRSYSAVASELISHGFSAGNPHAIMESIQNSGVF